MITYSADKYEAEFLREVFGDTVDSVTFWDTEEGGGSFALIEGYDRDGKQVGRLRPGDDNFDEVQELASDRGETVKFGLHGIAPLRTYTVEVTRSFTATVEVTAVDGEQAIEMVSRANFELPPRTDWQGHKDWAYEAFLDGERAAVREP